MKIQSLASILSFGLLLGSLVATVVLFACGDDASTGSSPSLTTP